MKTLLCTIHYPTVLGLPSFDYSSYSQC